MNHHVNATAGRLSLRPPQGRSLEILDRVTEIVSPKKGADVAAALETIQRCRDWWSSLAVNGPGDFSSAALLLIHHRFPDPRFG